MIIVPTGVGEPPSLLSALSDRRRGTVWIGKHCPHALFGHGGQVDFVRAANRSRGGKSFIVLPSTAKDHTISRIVPTLCAGTHATTSKNDVTRGH